MPSFSNKPKKKLVILLFKMPLSAIVPFLAPLPAVASSL